jgi:uncharacterized protein YsxB (DUF464 family)
MIEVCWHPIHYRLTVKGHARSNEAGKDLVCAGASTLTMAMAANVETMEKRGMLWKTQIRLESGDAEIQCNPKTNYKSVAALAMEAIVLGFDALAAQYPEYIRVVCLG